MRKGNNAEIAKREARDAGRECVGIVRRECTRDVHVMQDKSARFFGGVILSEVTLVTWTSALSDPWSSLRGEGSRVEGSREKCAEHCPTSASLLHRHSEQREESSDIPLCCHSFLDISIR